MKQQHGSRPLITMGYRSPSRKTAFQRDADAAAKLERNHKYQEAESAWIKAANSGDSYNDVEWATCRAHYCAKAQGKDVAKGHFIGNCLYMASLA